MATIRGNVKTNIAVTDLAAECGMSLSAFHKHFKAVTAASQLPYQKDLRLLEAHRLLSSNGLSVAAAV